MQRIYFLASALVGFCLVGGLAAHHAAAAANDDKDIVQTVTDDGQFKTLATALEAAGLIDTLKGDGPFTVFAPTDEAFAKLPKEKLEALLKDKEALKDILTYHVVAKKVMAADVAKLDSAKTVEGKSVAIEATDGKVKVGGANVTKTDIECKNGVIHVIDTVLMPPDDKKE